MSKKIFVLIVILALGWGSIILAQEVEQDLPRPVSSDTSIQGEDAPDGARDIIISATVETETDVDEVEIIQEIEQEQTVLAEDLEAKEPKLLPTSRFYFLKDWWRDTKLAFTFNTVKKAMLRQRIANEKLLEIKKMVESNESPEILEKAKQKYEIQQVKLQRVVEKFQEKTIAKPEQLEIFKEKFSEHQILHNTILEKLETQISNEGVATKIRTMRETHLEQFGATMFKLEDADKIPERLEKALENVKGPELKEFRQLEFLRKVENKLEDEDKKEALQQTQEKIIEQLKTNIEALPVARQQRIGTYVEHLPGDKEYQLGVMEKLKERVEDKGEIKQKLEQGSIRLRTRIEESNQSAPSVEPTPLQPTETEYLQQQRGQQGQ